MIMHPSVIALLVSSLLISLMVLGSSLYGVRIIQGWDLTSGSERQLALERSTYLISTILGYFLGFQVISLFLFIHTADSLSSMLVGAMCAVGTLTAHPFGYPLLLTKVVTCILAGLWLILNHADSKGYDYPLIRIKYLCLAVGAPLIVGESLLQWAFFLGLTPDIITSCCGSLFSATRESIAAEIASLPTGPTKIAFYGGTLLTCASGLRFYLKGTLGYLFSALSGLLFIVAIVAVISFISLYYYQLPSHHCPFCILQTEYGCIGYPLYVLLLTGVVTGLGTGMLLPFRGIKSLGDTLPSFMEKLALTSVISYLASGLITTWPMLFSGLRLA